MLPPARFAWPAKIVKLSTSQSTPALRSRSFEFFSDRYSATSLRPARRALRSASDNAAAQASSSSLILACRWYHERRFRPPTTQIRNLSRMIPSYRVLSRLFAAISAVALFLLISVNPLAQSGKLPRPDSHVSDFAGVIDAQTKSRLENLLQKLKEKSNVELYVAMVDTTGAQDVSAFSQQLARDWNIGAKTTRGKSLLLVVSVASKTSFTQFSRTAQTALPDGVLGEMSYRMHGLLDQARFAEAIDSGVHVFASALAEKIGFNLAELEGTTVATNSSEVASDSPLPVLVSATNTPSTRARKVADVPQSTAQGTPPVETPRTDPTPAETPAASEPTPSESPKPEPTPGPTPAAESPKIEELVEPRKR